MGVFQCCLFWKIVHDYFRQGCKIRMKQNMPFLFCQFADLDTPGSQFRKKFQRDLGFQTDNIIQKGGIPRALRPHKK